MESFAYRSAKGTADGVPWVVEVAFGCNPDGDHGRRIVTGINWSPGIGNPFRNLNGISLGGVEQTSVWTTRKIRAIRALLDETTRYIRTGAPKMPHAVIEQIFTRPYCRIANLVDAKVAARHTASAYLKELVSLGILEEEKVGRDKVFLHRKYIDVLFGEEHTFEPYPHRSEPASAE